MITALLIIHGLVAVALLGAVTHQGLSVLYPAVQPATTFLARFRSVHGASYVNAVVLLYAVNFALGAFLYATYRVDVRPFLEDSRNLVAAGAFETKEHLAAIGLGILPAYWAFWKAPALADNSAARRNITVILALLVWWNFLVGHVVNNLFGLG